MGKKLGLMLVLNIGLLSGCTTLFKRGPANLEINQVESVKVGQSKEEVVQKLGAQSAIKIVESNNQKREVWFYDDHDKNAPQRANVAFDTNKHSVVSVTVIPKPTERESQLSYLKTEKFKKLKFQEVPFKRCQRSSTPPQVFYVNTQAGLILNFNSQKKLIENFFWTTPNDARNLVRDINTCRR